jgi:hypothetical protein
MVSAAIDMLAELRKLDAQSTEERELSSRKRYPWAP